MTSHKGMLEKRSKNDELGMLIRCSLQGRVAGASPSPEVWERIRARAEQSTVQGRIGFVRGGYRAAMIQLPRRFLSSLAKVNAFLFALGAQMWRQNAWKEWRFDPSYMHMRLLTDQCGVRWLLAL